MKNNLFLIIAIGLIIFLTSCTKQKLPVGAYSFTFENTEGVEMEPLILNFEIIESSRDYVILDNYNHDTLFKDGTNITGTISYYGSIAGTARNIIFTPFCITGVYDKTKGIYHINGTYSSKVIIPNPEDQSMDTIDTKGIFEFKSIF